MHPARKHLAYISYIINTHELLLSGGVLQITILLERLPVWEDHEAQESVRHTKTDRPLWPALQLVLKDTPPGCTEPKLRVTCCCVSALHVVVVLKLAIPASESQLVEAMHRTALHHGAKKKPEHKPVLVVLSGVLHTSHGDANGVRRLVFTVCWPENGHKKTRNS